MPKTPTPSQRLQQLLAERQQFEQWLVALDARRAAAPPHVVERVESDYRKRLDAIKQELATRAEELRERIAVLTGKLSGFERDAAERRDKKAEQELRAAVGELSQERWTTLATQFDQDIAAVTSQREALEREIAELQGILAQSAGAPASRPTPVPANVRVAPDATAVRPSPAPTPAPTPPPTPAVKRATPAAPQPAKPDSAQPQRKTPSASRPARNDKEKTLKCGECGTLNYPTEWYCESCGAELAAM